MKLIQGIDIRKIRQPRVSQQIPRRVQCSKGVSIFQVFASQGCCSKWDHCTEWWEQLGISSPLYCLKVSSHLVEPCWLSNWEWKQIFTSKNKGHGWVMENVDDTVAFIHWECASQFSINGLFIQVSCNGKNEIYWSL